MLLDLLLENTFMVLLVIVGAYFFGCFNGAVIVSKYILRDDVRNHGSGNAGLTNFYRTFGGVLTFVVIGTDVLKAVLAVLLGSFVLSGIDPELMVLGKLLAGMCCILGHMFPCMFRFKGGKGILSGGTIAIMLDWRVAIIVWGAFIILVLLTRFVSLGSIAAGVGFPLTTGYFIGGMDHIILATIIGFLLVWGHRANIKRLLAGEENKFSFRRKKAGGT
ncbi:glycerol-3-phosphate acyltransferase [Bengtsoniella intestinalis]|uniref:glycerol-3-phosphate acyltransferase n=1 Tax=Bengtsoniella intestinalis TaxID=3073143 RepID=UPI00391F9ADC